jgi:RNA polymerase primary sigma factor
MTYQIDVRDHQGLVGMVVRPWLKTIRASGCIDFEDLMQVGNLALLRAAETYDESKGAWSTYACYWVRHHVHREVADKVRTVRVPPNQQKNNGWKRHPLASTKMFWTSQRGGRNARETEVCLVDMLQHRFPPTPSAEDKVIADQSKRGINLAALENLSDKQRLVVRMRFWEDKTLQQIGDVLGLSRERVRQIEADSLQKLRRVVGEYV